jgi:hypothetical protein
MITFTYQCKKNGKDYGPFTCSADTLSTQDEYAWRKGLNEYMDNYTASVTKAGMVSYKKGEKVVTPWADDTEYARTVDEWNIEARDRFNAGDVATGRQSADPKVAEARRQVAELAKVSATPEELAAAIAFINKQREKAGQGIAGKAQSKAA